MKSFLLAYILLFLQSSYAVEENFKVDISFSVSTNVDAISFDGELENKNLAKVEVSNNEIKNVKASIPVNNLSTGIEVRDSHMFEKVFKGINKKIEFISTSSCQLKYKKCNLKGKLSFATKEKDIILPLKISQSKNGKLIVNSEVNISLSSYGITAPTYMGVSVEDEIPIIIKVTQE